MHQCACSEADPEVRWDENRWWQADATYAALATKVYQFERLFYFRFGAFVK